MRQKYLVNKQLSIEEAKAFLEDKGFVIVEPCLDEGNKIINIILCFYQHLNELYNSLGYGDLIYTTNEKSDKKAIQNYLKINSEFGITRTKALDNLKNVIELFFEYYQEIKLDKPITNIKFLLTNGSWIIDKVRTIYKSKLDEYRSCSEMDQWFDRLCEQEDDKIKELRKRRHLELLGELNGKKEEN